MYRSFNPICQSILIYMVQSASGQTTISKTTRNTHACRDGTSDEGRFYGKFRGKLRILIELLFFSSRINVMRIRSNGPFASWPNFEKILNGNVVVI